MVQCTCVHMHDADDAPRWHVRKGAPLYSRCVRASMLNASPSKSPVCDQGHACGYTTFLVLYIVFLAAVLFPLDLHSNLSPYFITISLLRFLDSHSNLSPYFIRMSVMHLLGSHINLSLYFIRMSVMHMLGLHINLILYFIRMSVMHLACTHSLIVWGLIEYVHQFQP
jgi:hypothetical protein